MYVGITRARRSLAVSWTKRRKKGREMVSTLPSRFIKEMGLDAATSREDPREAAPAARRVRAQGTAVHARRLLIPRKTPHAFYRPVLSLALVAVTAACSSTALQPTAQATPQSTAQAKAAPKAARTASAQPLSHAPRARK